jgi:hypothetical protein
MTPRVPGANTMRVFEPTRMRKDEFFDSTQSFSMRVACMFRGRLFNRNLPWETTIPRKGSEARLREAKARKTKALALAPRRIMFRDGA